MLHIPVSGHSNVSPVPQGEINLFIDSLSLLVKKITQSAGYSLPAD